MNLADEDIAVRVDYVDEASGRTGTIGEITVTSFGMLTQRLPAGVFAFRFQREASTATPTACTLAVADGTTFEFTVLPDSVLILRPDASPGSVETATADTSPLCRR